MINFQNFLYKIPERKLKQINKKKTKKTFRFLRDFWLSYIFNQKETVEIFGIDNEERWPGESDIHKK